MNRILVVDDEISVIDALCDILRPAYDVIVAKNGRSAIERANRHMPSLILLDVILPDMTGFEVISALKNSELTSRIPVIFITGLGDVENEEKGLLLGAVDYISKPFQGSTLKAKVQTQLQIVDYINTTERLCKVDALTNIPNRRLLDEQITVEWKRAARNGRPLGFMMMDIDHFKKYNDAYGHPQGDKLLQSVAAVFKQSLKRPSDLAARWGGEEFAAIMPDTGLDGMFAVAERIRAAIEGTIVTCVDGTETSVTVSIGINSHIPSEGDSIEAFISRADQALYAAKISGRNCIKAFCDVVEDMAMDAQKQLPSVKKPELSDNFAPSTDVAAVPDAPAEHSILAVDDASFLLTTLKATLKNTGYNFTGVTSGEAALRFLDKHKVDLLILDIEMPDMNGYELAAKIRERGYTAPIIYLTGKATKDYVYKAVQAGAVDIIAKPFSREQVNEKIKKYIQ